MSLAEDLRKRVARLAEAGLLRQPPVLEQHRARPEAVIDGRRVLVFCSNDYLGLAGHPALRAGMAAAVSEETNGATASRLVAGTAPAHRAAERELAALVGLPGALLFSSGYAANVGALSALIEPDDLVLSDELNHASLIDGTRLARGKVHVYPHGRLDVVAEVLGRHRGRAWIVTDAVFSMDGDRAPLAELRALADAHGAFLYVDEAHSLGVLGEGAGLCRELGIQPDVLVGTGGKALGLAGAFVAGAPELRTFLENRARSYVYSTGVPPVLARALVVASRLVVSASEQRSRVLAHAARIRGELRGQGWKVPEGSTPIIPLHVGDAARVMQLSAALLEQGFFVQGIRPPTVRAGTARLRIAPSAAHEPEQVTALLQAFATLPR